jgi:[ribosomal protein S18]-alanine N-acetyltransferase
MQFNFIAMDESHACAIAGWHYEGIYSFYDMDQDPEDLQELLDPHNWKEKYFAVMGETSELVGFFSFENDGEVVDIGLGLRPDCTGLGWGQEFVEAGLEFARQKFNPSAFRLIVAAFNQRAIRVYEHVGFEDAGTFMNETNGGQYEFLSMKRLER